MTALGRHFLVELYNCDRDILDEVAEVERLMTAAARAADATIIHVAFHHFSPTGVSGVVVIQESHLTIHTWPELGYAAVDVFTCGRQMDPQVACELIQQKLGAEKVAIQEIERGRELLDSNPALRQASGAEIERNIWFTQRNSNMAFSLRHVGDLPYRAKSGLQKIEIYDTLAFGRMLSLDGKIAITAGDEYIYHEMLVHVPIQSLQQTKRVLIIGGGDGAAAREVLRYASIQEVVIVEQDERVIAASQTHLQALNIPWQDKRLQIQQSEGAAYTASLTAGSFDLIILDAFPWGEIHDSKAISHQLETLYQLLSPQGGMVVQSAAPRFQPEIFQDTVAACRSLAGKEKTFPYLTYVPTYPTGTWSFVFVSKGNPPLNFPTNSARESNLAIPPHLRYYNAAIHQASFALPNDIQEMIAE